LKIAKFIDNFLKNLKYQISLKSVQWEPSYCLRTGRQTDGREEGNYR